MAEFDVSTPELPVSFMDRLLRKRNGEVPWARPGDRDAFAEDEKVVIVCDDGTWYGPYYNRGSATRSAKNISTRGDNEGRKVPFQQMRLVTEHSFSRNHNMHNVKFHRVAADAPRLW